MRASKTEKVQAERVSAAVDQLLRQPGAVPEGLDPDEAGVLTTAQQFARLPDLLGPVPPVLEQQVMRQVQAAGRPVRGVRRPGWGWAAAGLVTVLLVVVLLTPLGQTAVAGFLAAFSLGRTEVTIQPVYTPSALPATALAGATAVRESLGLEEAQGQVSYAIPQPAYLPSGYRLAGVNGYTYPDLPAWVPQPFFLELVYKDGAGDELILRVYSIALGDAGSISKLNLQATSIQDARDVDVSGQAGVLLQLGSDRTGAVWQELVWEQDELIVALSSGHLGEDELLRVARSIR
ncbi:MAG: DUF4367 domain-containing protein [Anaerolineae bacterium]|jgi:hypothetical protein